MEMTFPHEALDHKPVGDRHDYRALLATAIARQANSRTAQAMLSNRRRVSVPTADALDSRIHYFGSHDAKDNSPFGAFGPVGTHQGCDKTNDESVVYHAGSTNIKDSHLSDDGTGERSNLAGQSISRMI